MRAISIDSEAGCSGNITIDGELYETFKDKVIKDEQGALM